MIIGDGIMLGAGGESASIFVTGLSETDMVTATKGSKTLTGEWITRKNTEIKSLIPVMTSNTTPEGVASSYSVSSGISAYYAFDAYGDDVGSDYYTSYPYSAGNDYIQYEFASSVKISKVRMNIFNDRAFTYTILISENGQDWTNVCVFSQDSSLTSGITWMEKDLETVVTAKFIRCRIDHWTDKTGNPAVIREMRVYGPVETEVSGFLISRIKDFGTWTVTATNGTNTAMQDVLVDTITEYVIEMDLNKLYLYNEGDECEDVTGGWYQNQSATFLNGYCNGTYQLVKNENSLYFPTVYKDGSNATTRNKIDMSLYTRLFVEAEATSTSGYNLFPVITTDLSSNPNELQTALAGEKATYEIDISSYNENAYLAFFGYSGQTYYIYKVWLE